MAIRNFRTKAAVPDFSYSPNDALAEMIVAIWSDEDLRNLLFQREGPDKKVTDAAAQAARLALAARGFHLKRAVVIKESEYDDDYQQQAADEVVFVLPDHTRPGNPGAGQSRLDTARLLMACTPHGI